MTFYFFGGIAATALTVLMLGLSGSFGVSRRSYILQLPASQQLGAGKTMGVVNSAYRIGQVLGPMLLGWLVLTKGIRSITYLGVFYLVITLLFLLFASTRNKDFPITEDQAG
jgi:predicted MFS family arabinose efflux permease